MLNFSSHTRFGRRNFLQAGSLALGGLALPQFLARGVSGAGEIRPITDKAVVFLFLHGGPSQTETFDPKMTAPAGVSSATGEVSTKLPGITFGGTFPKLAAMADRLTIVRSFTTMDGNHDIKPIVGRDTGNANLGSLYSRVAGQNRPISGLPTNVALFPRAVDPSTQAETSQFGKFNSSGTLGTGYAPFVPGAGGDLQQNMELTLPMDRLDDRRLVLSSLDRMRRKVDNAGIMEGIDDLRQQAFDTLCGGAADAFQLSQEEESVIANYDTAPLMRPDMIDKKWKNYNNYVDNAKSLGKLMLLARRLVERGCGFVTVTTNFVWDMHSDVNNAGVEEGMRYMGHPLDHAVSAFLEDLAQRGLSDKVLLVCCGEMGRTPRINAKGGRDHWGNLAPLLLAGGGLPEGQVIGQSTRDGGEPQTEPIRPENLVSTVLGTLFDVSQLRLTRGLPPEILRATSPAPITSFA
ncbi:MAG: DUF1501 domain-containing protein [Planctomycetaceae bacterium]